MGQRVVETDLETVAVGLEYSHPDFYVRELEEEINNLCQENEELLIRITRLEVETEVLNQRFLTRIANCIHRFLETLNIARLSKVLSANKTGRGLLCKDCYTCKPDAKERRISGGYRLVQCDDCVRIAQATLGFQYAQLRNN